MDKIIQEAITFDDVLLIPGYTNFPREDADTQTILHKNIKLKLPIISSPMDTVTEDNMLITMAQNGGLGILHRNLPIDKQIEMVKKCKNAKVNDIKKASLDSSGKLLAGVAVGAGDDLEDRVKLLINAGIDIILVDASHGHSQYILDAIQTTKKICKDIPVIGGNVTTGEGAKALIKHGADIIRVGVGPGSICTTRIVTGTGVPQLTAIDNVIKGIGDNDVTIIADGGIRQTGDMAKAIGFGANVIMLGSLLSGFDQSPGEIVEIEGDKYKLYRGMGSSSAMFEGSAARYGQKTGIEKKKLISEGVEGLVKYKGDVEDYLYQIQGSLRSAFYNTGAKNIIEFHEKAKFVKITNAGMKESHPHTISIKSADANYNV